MRVKNFQENFKITRSDCWEWTGTKHRDGYGQYRGGKHRKYAHRVSYELYKGEIPEGMFVCHTCDNPPCVNPSHLFLGTPKDNKQDAVRKERHARGTKVNTAKLSEDQVKTIINSTSLCRILAEEYAVSPTLIAMIRRKVIWKHVS